MFGKKKAVPLPVQKEIVVIGNSVRTLYHSVSRRLHPAVYIRSAVYEKPDITDKEMQYEDKYWFDPVTPFTLGGQDCRVTQVQAVVANDGKAYLLNVSHVIKVEESLPKE